MLKQVYLVAGRFICPDCKTQHALSHWKHTEKPVHNVGGHFLILSGACPSCGHFIVITKDV